SRQAPSLAVAPNPTHPAGAGPCRTRADPDGARRGLATPVDGHRPVAGRDTPTPTGTRAGRAPLHVLRHQPPPAPQLTQHPSVRTRQRPAPRLPASGGPAPDAYRPAGRTRPDPVHPAPPSAVRSRRGRSRGDRAPPSHAVAPAPHGHHCVRRDSAAPQRPTGPAHRG